MNKPKLCSRDKLIDRIIQNLSLASLVLPHEMPAVTKHLARLSTEALISEMLESKRTLTESLKHLGYQLRN